MASTGGCKKNNKSNSHKKKSNTSVRGESTTHHHRQCSTTTATIIITARDKRDEMNHLANAVREDLRKGGLSFPKLQLTRSRVLPPGSGIDMSTVHHLSSGQASHSPYLALHGTSNNASLATSTSCQEQQRKFYDSASFLSDLIQSCSYMYEMPPPTFEERNNDSGIDVQEQQDSADGILSSDSESSTSSVTGQESGEDYNGCEYISKLTRRAVANHQLANDKDDSNNKSFNVFNNDNCKRVISIGEALSIRNSLGTYMPAVGR